MEDDEFLGIKIKKKEEPTHNKKKSKRKFFVKKVKKEDSSEQEKTPHKIKLIVIVIILFGVILVVLNLPIFTIKTIVVENNIELSREKIIEISGLEEGMNLFRINKLSRITRLESNPYILDAKISRKLPSEIVITVTERVPTYVLQFADSYVYINNQGYILEISNKPRNIPTIVGFTTDLSNIVEGGRIDVEDLKLLNTVIKIYETCKDNDLGEYVTKIDVSNTKDYVITMDDIGKVVYIGDGSELNTRIIYLKAILDANENIPGTIFLDVDLNTQRVYFRPNT